MEAEEKVAHLREEEDEAEASELGYDVDGLGPSYEYPKDEELEDDPNVWCGYMPPKEDGGEAIYIEGVFPNTALTRQALQLVEKKLRREPLIAMKEAQENLLRLCVKVIGDQDLKYTDMRGRGLDKYLDSKQMHFVTEFFDRLTTPEDTEVESFLGTVQTGRRKRRKK